MQTVLIDSYEEIPYFFVHSFQNGSERFRSFVTFFFSEFVYFLMYSSHKLV